MSHALGSRCVVCHTVLATVKCPERECAGVVHGWADVQPSAWAARTYPDHPCLHVVGTGAR